MTLSPEEKQALVTFKLEKCDIAYREMLFAFQNEMYSTAANRLYYAIFYACAALLLKNGLASHTHKGAFSLVNQHFIKEGIISHDFWPLLHKTYVLRQESDYDDFFMASKEDVEQYLAPSKEFIDLIKKLVGD